MSLLSPADTGLIDHLRAAADEVGTRASDRLAAAHDASHYLLTPQAVVKPRSREEVAALFSASWQSRVPMTFRSGGTSLSGQSVSDGVLVDTRRHFRDIDVLDDGARVRCGPGAVVRAVNARLLRHGRKLGPDPASEIACTIGGVVANNSSGMACGIEANTYRTLDSLVLVLPSGTVLDTSAADADEQLRRREPAIHAGLLELRDRVRTDTEAVARITQLHSIKNTMGYGLNSFLDHDDPVRILEHLVIGSEGTLAFVAEATFRTVPLMAHASTGLLVFDDLPTATSVLPEIIATGAATVELLDATSLRVAQRDEKCPEEIRGLDVGSHCALLVEFQEKTEAGLGRVVSAALPVFEAFSLSRPAELTIDPRRRSALWHTRKGLFTAVAGNRPSGTAALLEDIAVPVDRLGETCTDLSELFEQYDYADAVIFGHAKDGNIHFMITEEFGSGTGGEDFDLDRYAAFTEEMVDLVLSRGGTLKAEHGTGRIMAPFVRRQVGDDLYAVMTRVKELVDPQSLLNPGVLLSDDPKAHLRDLKTTPTTEAEVDRCVECGYCEPVCPSRDLTLTPRERIVLRREITRAEAAGDEELTRTLRSEYDYDGIDTCAVDGMCQTACPVFINTGDLVRRLRQENTNAIEETGWNAAAKAWGLVSSVGGVALSSAKAMPVPLPAAATGIARRLLGDDTVPSYSADLPAGGTKRVAVSASNPDVVWFSSCTNTMFGPEDGGSGDGVAGAFRRLCERAGISLRTPRGIPSLCCGTPWKSKGMAEGYATMGKYVRRELWEATDGGRIAVVCDASSCTEGLRVLLSDARDGAEAAEEFEIIDAVAFAKQTLLPALQDRGVLSTEHRLPSITLHPTCSSTQLGINEDLTALAGSIADEVSVPDSWGCCAFAGDRGMLHPELTASATKDEAAEVESIGADVHASTNRTCEIGMTRATGKPYRHILEALDDLVEASSA
ncbi:FAD-binding and (Fe-S)-binding domain-containing protein [Brevibacterium sp. RIT 803]|uniref:FAD-binding and (Fe-S)-binding domain-containing protein n=1 Tax=Brevibacterium sp. RIT 803 TaxID=2810210 RepID=UPI001950759E|nr:FAD-binding and (Fe-S)-binding domain-containing protein [Brevibacterium sp. RIT 803]MBM6591898.1 FAD-binding oxidoreductase [Brevibacterium sp. RIT 803]